MSKRNWRTTSCGLRIQTPRRHRAPALITALGLALSVFTGQLRAQHEHHHIAHGVELRVDDDTAAGVMTVRLGPLDLPARSSHDAVAQPPDRLLVIPFDGWLRAYHPRLTDGQGQTVPGRLLHHVAFWNTERSDFLCPNKEEHIFGAGGEMNDWMAVPGVGYPVGKGDRIRVSTMFHNPTETSYPDTYLEVKVEYARAVPQAAPLKSVYPVWFDVQECGSSDYDLAPGVNVTTGQVTMPLSGLLLGVGGHLHDFGTGLRLESASRDEEIAVLTPETDAAGRLLSMPIVTFFMQGGHRLHADEVVRVTASYDNRTGGRLPDGAMGIVVGYFLPDDAAQMAALKREGGG